MLLRPKYAFSVALAVFQWWSVVSVEPLNTANTGNLDDHLEPSHPSGADTQLGYNNAFVGSKAVTAFKSIDRTGWSVTASSNHPSNNPSNVLDNTLTTFWHSQYTPTLKPLPQNITIDMKKSVSVNGFTYLPRQDASNNGNVGQHKVEISKDGVNWKVVATGTFANDKTMKQSEFASVSARFLRFTAITEGQGGPWASAAELGVLSGAAGIPVDSEKAVAAPTLGQWGPTINFPIVPVASALLHNNGKMLVWSSFKPDNFGGANGFTVTATYDPVSGTVSQRTVSNTGHDMFCPGISIDFGGRVVVTGGDDSSKTSIYDPTTDAWTTGPPMKIGRGYQSTATMSDGRVFMIGGSWSGGRGGKDGEVLNAAESSWKKLPGAPVAPMLTVDKQGVFREDNHGWLFGWKQGWVFQAGPSKAMNWYNPNGGGGNGSFVAAGLRGTDTDAMNGNAVMYDAVNGLILTLGGGQNYQDTPATANANIIKIGNPGTAVTVTRLTPMSFARAFANAVVLPDGKVFVTGGQTLPVPFSDNTAILQPELWDPATNNFTKLPAMGVARTYHSVALLLTDGTVFSGGGGLCGSCSTNHFNGQRYFPAYLFNSDGSLATRPKITSATPTSAVVGTPIVVKTDTAVTRFSLIRIGSNTHTVNTDQRRIALTPTGAFPTYTITIPTDPGVALPGYWMLFALNTAGVPSVGAVIQVKLS